MNKKISIELSEDQALLLRKNLWHRIKGAAGHVLDCPPDCHVDELEIAREVAEQVLKIVELLRK